MRYVFAPLRVVGLLLHIIAGLAILAVAFPWLAQPKRNRIIRRWSRLLLAFCGTRLRVTGVGLDPELAQGGVLLKSHGRLLLSNHVSWIDVFAIDGAIPSRFVAKSEIGRWLLLGPLVTRSGTLYIERGRRHAVAEMNRRVRDRLHAGETVAVFPEGTTTDGFSLLPFHSNLIAPALEAGCEIWPVVLRYTERGSPSSAAGFVGEMGLVTSLWNILVARDFQIEVEFLAPIAIGADTNRHRIAHEARVAIATALGVTIDEHPVGARSRRMPPSSDTAPEPVSDPASASR